LVAISEKERRELFNRLEEALGPEGAGTLMDMLPPAGWADVATKHDLAALEQRLGQRIDGLEQRFDDRFGGLDQRVDGLDQVFVTKAELHAQTRTFITWTLTSQATLVAVVALLVSLT
jgi:hypothetical protein